MKQPDFILVGGSRCGSTSLYETIIQHPNVILPSQDTESNFNYENSNIDISQKELRFFDRNWNKGAKWYLNRFKNVQNTIVGDASATYLYYPGALERIKEVAPNSKIIVLLRNPVDRLVSHFNHLKKIDPSFDDQYKSFELFIQSELTRRSYHHIIKRGFYYASMKKCVNLFPNQTIIVKSEDLFSTDKSLTTILKFLELSPHSLKLEHFRKSNSQTISKDLRELLNRLYEPQTKALYNLLRVDYAWF